MSSFLPDPVEAGTVDPSQLAKVTELHATVRQWIADSVAAQNNEHLKPNEPYVDLLFALGFATLGDAASAKKLLEDARRVMEGPIPAAGNPLADFAVCKAIVHNFLFKGLRYRIEQARIGQPHAGSLSAELLVELAEITKKGNTGSVHNPYKLAEFVINRFRHECRILEPSERVDPYLAWSKHTDISATARAELPRIADPAQLADRIRTLYREDAPGRKLTERRVLLLADALPLAARVGETFAVELLECVPAALGIGAEPDQQPDMPVKQTEVLASALWLAAHFRRADQVRKLLDVFLALVRREPEGRRYSRINSVISAAMRALTQLGLEEDLNRLLNALHGQFLQDATLAEL